jgi:hypothetical protein
MERHDNPNDIRTDADRRLAHAAAVLFARLKQVLHNREMTNALYARCVSTVEDHHAQCWLMGIEFPRCVVVWLDGVRAVKVIRADIARRDLEQQMLNWTVEHPEVSAAEIDRALRRHFPGYRGGVPEVPAAVGTRAA